MPRAGHELPRAGLTFHGPIYCIAVHWLGQAPGESSLPGAVSRFCSALTDPVLDIGTEPALKGAEQGDAVCAGGCCRGAGESRHPDQPQACGHSLFWRRHGRQVLAGLHVPPSEGLPLSTAIFYGALMHATSILVSTSDPHGALVLDTASMQGPCHWTLVSEGRQCASLN